MMFRTRQLKSSSSSEEFPYTSREVDLGHLRVCEFFLLEMNDKIVNRPSAMINGKIAESDEPMKFDSFEEADRHGALLLSLGQGNYYTILDYTELW